jgi:membrane-associated phospholipid phosphatase
MKNKICLSLLIIIIYGSTSFGQLKYTFSQFGNETWEFVKQPTKWDGIDYVKLGVMGFLTYEIMLNCDQPIRTAVLKDQRYYKSFPIEFGRMWGELYAPVILFSGFAIHSLITDDITTRKIAYEIGQASLYAGAVTFLLKAAIGRARPYTEEGTHSFHPFSSIFIQDNHSIPGGHVTAAMVLSTVLSRNAKPVWLKVLAYLPAVLTFISRPYQDKHWTSDEFAGAVLGYFIATWVVDKHENNKSIVEVSSTYPLSVRIALN